MLQIGPALVWDLPTRPPKKFDADHEDFYIVNFKSNACVRALPELVRELSRSRIRLNLKNRNLRSITFQFLHPKRPGMLSQFPVRIVRTMDRRAMACVQEAREYSHCGENRKNKDEIMNENLLRGRADTNGIQ